MFDEPVLARITCSPAVLAGKPVIRGTRLSVDYVLNLLGHGQTEDDILREYAGLEREDIRAVLLFAGRALADTAFVPATSA